VLEGYFPDRPHHRTSVQVEEGRTSLILSPYGIEGSSEERTDIPLSQAQALLAVAPGQVAYLRTSLLLGLDLLRFRYCWSIGKGVAEGERRPHLPRHSWRGSELVNSAFSAPSRMGHRLMIVTSVCMMTVKLRANLQPLSNKDVLIRLFVGMRQPT
jgi:hypothetical protein